MKNIDSWILYKYKRKLYENWEKKNNGMEMDKAHKNIERLLRNG